MRALALVGLTVSLTLTGCGAAHSASPFEGSAGAAAGGTAGIGSAGREETAGTSGTAAYATGGNGAATGGAAGAGGAAGTAGWSPGSASAGGLASMGGAAGTYSVGGGGNVNASGGTAGGGAGAGGGTDCAGLICEDFEGGAIDPQKWQTLTSGGSAAIQMQTVAHGSYALHLHGQGSGSDDWAILVVKNVPFALKGNTTFGRMNVYWGAEAAVSLHMQFPFAGRSGTGSVTGPAPFPKLRYLEVGSYFGGWQLGIDLLDYRRRPRTFRIRPANGQPTSGSAWSGSSRISPTG